MIKLHELINVIEHNELVKYEDIKQRVKQLKAFFEDEIFFTPIDSYGIYGLVNTRDNVVENIEEYLNEMGIGGEESEEYQNNKEILLFNTIAL